MATVPHIHDVDPAHLLNPSAAEGAYRDAYISAEATGSNFGGSTSLLVKRLASDPKSGDPIKDTVALVYWDLKRFLPADAVITAAVWHAWVWANTLTTGHNIKIVRVRRNVAPNLPAELGATWLQFGVVTQAPLVATSGGNDWLEDSGIGWVVDEWVGQWVEQQSHGGDGEGREVVSNTSERLYVTPDWGTNPGAGVSYAINRWRAGGCGSVASDIDTGVIDDLGDMSGLGSNVWMVKDIINVVSDAWSSRNGICAFRAYRSDVLDESGHMTWYTKEQGALFWPHCRITYTLNDATFQAFVFDSGIAVGTMTPKSFAETASLSETLATTVTFAQLFAETASMAEAFGRRIALGISETASFSEALARKIARTFAETASASEAFASRVIVRLPFAETMSMSETLSTLKRVGAIFGGVLRRIRRKKRDTPEED